jgi:hypothetical protein
MAGVRVTLTHTYTAARAFAQLRSARCVGRTEACYMLCQTYQRYARRTDAGGCGKCV